MYSYYSCLSQKVNLSERSKSERLRDRNRMKTKRKSSERLNVHTTHKIEITVIVHAL